MTIIVTESLIAFQDEQLLNKLLLEGFNPEDLKKIQSPKGALSNLLKKTNSSNTNSSRIKLIMAIIALVSYMSFPRTTITQDKIKEKAIELSTNPTIEKKDVYDATKELVHVSTQKTIISPIAMTDEKVKILNAIVPNRFSSKKLEQYNQYDKAITEAVKELKAAGQSPNIALIKGIMLIETGMVPRKNHLGYKGFPQTKMKQVRSINKRHKTNFTKEDLYDAKQSAKFIHYMIITLKKSRFVKWDREALAAYNWGLGNFSKYRIGKKKMPTETTEYVKMISAFVNK